MDRLGPDIFSQLCNERTCFASCACPFKSSELITRLECASDQKVVYVLSRLNEINGGCEKILPLSIPIDIKNAPSFTIFKRVIKPF